MDISELASAAVMSGPSNDPEEIYKKMVAVALDLRSLPVVEDWHEELWDLAQDLRKLLPPASPLPSSETASVMPEIMGNLNRIGVKKSRSQVSLEKKQQQSEIARISRQLRQIRDNACFDVKIDSIEPGDYQACREEQSQVLARRLQEVEKFQPTNHESLSVARGYLEMLTFWRTVKRPSTGEEREKSLRVMVDFEHLQIRIARYFEERDRVIFLWEEPAEEPDLAKEREAIEKGVITQLEEVSKNAPD